MRLVKTRPHFRCDFCRHTATEEAMKRHEKICWLNPNRYCDCCSNTGYVDYGPPYYQWNEQCIYCKQETPGLVEEILVRRKFGPDYQ